MAVDPRFCPSQIRVRLRLLTTAAWWGVWATRRHQLPPVANPTLVSSPQNNWMTTPKWNQRNPRAEKLRHPTPNKEFTWGSPNIAHILRIFVSTVSNPHAPGLWFWPDVPWQLQCLVLATVLNSQKSIYLHVVWGTMQQKPPQGNQIGKEKGQVQDNTFLFKKPKWHCKLMLSFCLSAVPRASAWVNTLAFTPSHTERSNYLLESKGSPKSFDAGKK